jgi:4-hydroxythreonine-4-phosphate dehydrogenase
MNLPRIAVTMGDPTGIGPEVIAGCWSDPAVHACCQPLVIGRPEVLRRAVARHGLPLEVVPIDAPEAASPAPGRIPCLTAGVPDADEAPVRQVDARGGQAAYDALIAAIDLALACRVQGITTAPLNKAALWAAGHRYPGHTELLAERCGAGNYAMMLYLARDNVICGPAGLGVIHTTLHMGLREVFAHLSTDQIVAKIGLADAVMRAMRHDGAPRIGVCALNPHAGESGLFGDEESRLIAPAVQWARQQGIDVEGPYPADTLMVRARDGEFDAVVAMYHDQGHIALKLLGMHRAVNVTLGLPIVRTSVAHGTAFDLAWRTPPAPLGDGGLQTSSMVEALRVAARLSATNWPAAGSTARSHR